MTVAGLSLAAAGIEPETLAEPWTVITTAFSGKGLFFWTLLAVVGAIVAWAIFVRKPDDQRRRRHHWRDRHRESGHSHHGSLHLFRRRKHRRRKKNRPRNPTLAETGGLPPPRPPEARPPDI